jgi:RimJ/RimL family protein N-acetyltransferase
MIPRRATPADAVPLSALINQIIAAGGTTAHETPFTPDQFGHHDIAGPEVICCHLVDGPLGFQGLWRWADLPEDWGDIGTFVAPAARGTGAGAALLKATLDLARREGLRTINATIRADNALGLACYGKLGFRDYAAEPAFGLKNGSRVGRISKRLDL